MNILISGASGLIGQALHQYFQLQGHTVYTLQRQLQQGSFFWKPDSSIMHVDTSISIDAVINLNGANIGEQRWSDNRKRVIQDSRIRSTQLLATTLSQLPNPPSVFISASAVGYYGDTGNEIVSEEAPSGHNFLADIAEQWEAACDPAVQAGIRTIYIRTSMVLAQQGGALKSMLLPFKLGLGGIIGHGRQLMSWISLTDECRAIDFLMNHSDLSGPFNLSAPNCISNREFTKALGKTLHRPTLLPMPALAVKTLFGEMGDLLLLGSVGAYPQRLLSAGFEFKHKNIAEALSAVLEMPANIN